MSTIVDKQLKTIAYANSKGKAPFLDWLRSLKDLRSKQIIQTRIDRVATGNLGDVKSLGGDKKSQSKDILKAREYLKDWKENG